MLETVKTQKVVEINESDIVTLVEAARLTGRNMSSIGIMLDRGSLPWYEYPPDIPGKAGQRYTSRAALAKLPAEKTRGMASRKSGRTK